MTQRIVQWISPIGVEPTIEAVLPEEEGTMQFFAKYKNGTYQILQARGCLETQRSDWSNYRITIMNFLDSTGKRIAGERQFSMPEGTYMAD